MVMTRRITTYWSGLPMANTESQLQGSPLEPFPDAAAIALRRESSTMSVAFTREESAATAAEVDLPDRPISPHPNVVTASGPEALTKALTESRTAYDAAQRVEDAGERRQPVAVTSRDMRYFADSS
jgi:hypothetical protein